MASVFRAQGEDAKKNPPTATLAALGVQGEWRGESLAIGPPPPRGPGVHEHESSR